MKKYLKFLIIPLLSLTSLCSCMEIHRNLSADEIHIMKKAYYQTYVEPNEADPRKLTEIKYYDILFNKGDIDGGTIAVAVWEKYEDTDQWNLEIENGTFSFTYEMFILAYRFRKNEFVTMENAVELNVLSCEELQQFFQKLDEYKGFTEA